MCVCHAGTFVAQYTKKQQQAEGSSGSGSGGGGSRLHSAEIVHSFSGGDSCEGAADGQRSGAPIRSVLSAVPTYGMNLTGTG